MNAGVIFCVLIIVIAGTSLNYKRYQKKEITKKAFVTNLATVILLMIAGSVLLTLK
jgi:cation transporter-like permease